MNLVYTGYSSQLIRRSSHGEGHYQGYVGCKLDITTKGFLTVGDNACRDGALAYPLVSTGDLLESIAGVVILLCLEQHPPWLLGWWHRGSSPLEIIVP